MYSVHFNLLIGHMTCLGGFLKLRRVWGIIKLLGGQQLMLNLCRVYWSGIKIGSLEIIGFGLLKICNNFMP